MIVALRVEPVAVPALCRPATCMALALVVASLRHMRAAAGTSEEDGVAAQLLAAALACPIVLALCLCTVWFSERNPYTCWRCSTPGNLERASVLNRFRICRPPFTDRAEWSEAQLDERMGLERGGHHHAKVVWARDAGTATERCCSTFGTAPCGSSSRIAPTTRE